LTGFEELSIT